MGFLAGSSGGGCAWTFNLLRHPRPRRSGIQPPTVRRIRPLSTTSTWSAPKAAAPIDEVVLPGATQPFVNSPIYARTNGYLVKWFYDIGAKVKQGDLLAIIDTPELDKQLEQARADLETAKSNLALSKTTAERWQELVKTRSVSQQSTDQAVDNFGATQASVNSYAANVLPA